MFFKKINFLFLITIGVITSINAQEGCYTCNRDSLKAELKIAESPEEKFKLLKWIVDFDPTVDSANYFIDQLLELNKKNKEIDEAPYLLLKSANQSRQNNDNETALNMYHKVVDLFDVQHKKIPNLLLGFRNMYNLLNKQEERYIYYKKKLDYYLTIGPFENTASCYYGIGGYYSYTADFNQAISYYLRSADVFKKYHPFWYYNTLGVVGVYYADWGNYEKSLSYINYALPKLKATNRSEGAYGYYEYQLAQIKFDIKKFNEVLQHADNLIDSFNSKKTNRFYSIGLLYKAFALIARGNSKAAYPLLLEAKNLNDVEHKGRMTTANSTLEIDFGLYHYYYSLKQYAVAEVHLLEGYKKALAEQSNKFQLKYLQHLGDVSAKQNKYIDSRRYTEAHTALATSLDTQFNKFKIAQYEIEQKQNEQLSKINQLRSEHTEQQASINRRNIILYFSFGALLLIAGSLVVIYRQLRINKKTLKTLKETQSQLIQSEKMASLGELTAGIAHEIQNPLNFVNNFSELSAELLDEMQAELKEGNTSEAFLIASDVKENLRKITHHGKRADSIVKNMLQHSSKSSGIKEPTDLNALVDEYLKLSYHGFRAKDKNFNALLETYYDPKMNKVNVVAQDVGRVLLNLFNNAFYSVAKKKSETDKEYEPIVIVRTVKKGDGVEIYIKDNGVGIPEKVVDKIYQPFFTTKPTGEGTGLGLSLSYDIINKGHGGEMKVETKEDEYSEFVIQLPG
jgi:two-component system, NtrC family, sensor kinase